MKHQSIKVALGAILLTPCVSLADVVPAALFTDHMVIQRETQAPVWGSADAGEKVSVTGSWGESAATTADASGKWMVKLKTPEAGGPHTLTLKGNNTVDHQGRALRRSLVLLRAVEHGVEDGTAGQGVCQAHHAGTHPHGKLCQKGNGNRE